MDDRYAFISDLPFEIPELDAKIKAAKKYHECKFDHADFKKQLLSNRINIVTDIGEPLTVGFESLMRLKRNEPAKIMPEIFLGMEYYKDL